MEWWNGRMVEWMHVLYQVATFLVHVGNNKNLYHWEMKFWHERYL